METYIPLITGSGGALAVLMLWLSLILAGKLHTEQEFSKLEITGDRQECLQYYLRHTCNGGPGDVIRFSGIGEACAG